MEDSKVVRMSPKVVRAYPEAIRWSADGRAVDIIDQRDLPERETRLLLCSAEAVANAITMMAVRGAPAIGIAAAMGIALAATDYIPLEKSEFFAELDKTIEHLGATRPTAVNLFRALERVRKSSQENSDRPNAEIACRIYGTATAILEEDKAMCRAIGEHGATLLRRDSTVLTHCNAGALATGGMGTALAPIYVAHERGIELKVFADETRPLLQGSRLTVWELAKAGIDVTLIPDVVAASLMRSGQIDLVIVGADRIAANGDVANKIGTYGLAVLADHHGIPFYVAAPSSTIDLQTPSGAEITIEERDPDEVRKGFGKLTAPPDIPVFSPAFDVTPADLITAIITDRGIFKPRELEA